MSRYIDADALEEFFQRKRSMLESVGGDETALKAFDYVIKKIPEQPTADVAGVKHGEWNVDEFNKVRQVVVVECSECGCVLELPMSSWGLNYHYCPNCGAKMDGAD